MDIPREKKKSPKKYIIGTLAVAAVIATTVGLSRLKPAAPGVDRAAIWFGHTWSSTWKAVIDGLVFGLLTGGVFGWLWPG